MKTILVTGGAGFIGCNFVRLMLSKYSDLNVINVDLLTYAGSLKNLAEVMDNPRHIFIRADIRDRVAINEVFNSFAIDAVVNFAAESHVDRSIDDPAVFLTTNVVGTQVLLDAAKRSWKQQPHDKYCRAYRAGTKFVQISTDEVYGTLGPIGKFTEITPLQPNSPYSASKAGADMLVRAYHETYGLPINITRCSNNYGPHQFPEKLIPLMITQGIKKQDLPVYGDGLQIRDWIHVEDHCSAIDVVLQRGIIGEVYNIGGNNQVTNLELVKRILFLLGRSEQLIRHVKDRPGHDRRYAIDNSKISAELQWHPQIPFDRGLKQAVEWYWSIDNK